MNTPLEVGQRWFNEVWNERRISLIPDLMCADAKGHLEGGKDIIGTDEFMAFQKVFLDLFPDLKVEIIHSLSDQNDVCILWQAAGTHAGEAIGLVPTGKRIRFRGTTWFHLTDGRISEGWDCWDMGTVMKELSAATPSTK